MVPVKRQATNRRRILVDHVRKGKILIPPFVHRIGGLQEISWVQTLIPELTWIGLLHDRYGDKHAVELITAISRAARSTLTTDEKSSNTRLPVFVSASDFRQLPTQAWVGIRKKLETGNHLSSLREGLSPLAANYPTFPLGGLWESEVLSNLEGDLQSVKETLVNLLHKADRKAMMVQATAIWLWFDSGKLKIAEGLTLTHFPEIENYPETELSKKVGSSIRASLNTLFGMDSSYDTTSSWPIEFWDRGLVLEPCEFPHE